MASPADGRFTDTHEWHRIDGDTVTIGITKFAVDELTDITFVELPEEGDDIAAGESFGEIESVKATSELYAAVSGKVVAVNSDAIDNPAAINEDPFGAGWLVKLQVADTSPLDALMDAATYDAKYVV